MKGSSVGFSFFTLLILLATAIGHITIFASIPNAESSVNDFLVITPISILILSLNAFIVFGLRRQKKWAFLLGGIEMIILVITALVNIFTSDISEIFSSLIYGIFSISMLFFLRNDFNKTFDE